MTISWNRRVTLDQLRAACPDYDITDDRRLDPVRYTATARDTSARLYCLITSDLDELAALLAATAELAALRDAHPGWSFDAGWVAAGSGPDRRVLTASCGDITVTAFTPAGLAEKIAERSH